MKLSILDQSTHAAGIAPDQAIRDTVELAALADRLGYERFWVSEHHNLPTIVGTAPEILMAAISQRTKRIRLGSAGIMLPHYAPLKVAEQFRVLEALAPGRIDMGLGRAPGGDGMTAYALNPNAPEDAERFPANVRDLMAWVSGEALPAGHPFAGIAAHPETPGAPEPWMLGTSDYGAQVAAHFGIPYCFAHFITDGRGADFALELYRQRFSPSERFPEPVGAVCVWALAAETRAEAERLFDTRAAWKIRRDRGDLRPLSAPDDIDWSTFSEADLQRREQLRRDAIIGTGAEVHAQLADLARTLGISDVVVLTWTHDQQARRRSYELLAEAAGLAARAAA